MFLLGEGTQRVYFGTFWANRARSTAEREIERENEIRPHKIRERERERQRRTM
jgi:hypothetical protein